MSTQETRKKHPCILKVNMDCEGCAKKVQKLLLKIKGVKDVQTDVEQGIVLVVGDVDPNKLIQTLKNSKKNAEICGGLNNMKHNEKSVRLNLPDNGSGKKGGNHNEGENGNGGGRKSSGGFVKEGRNHIEGENSNGGGRKSRGGFVGRFAGFGKKSKNSNEKLEVHNNTSNDHDISNHHGNGRSQNGSNHHGNGGGYPYHHQGMQMNLQTPSYEQQQGMAMTMMNQQQQQTNINYMYPHAMMYGTSYPSMNYMLPPSMPSHSNLVDPKPVYNDGYTESCEIM